MSTRLPIPIAEVCPECPAGMQLYLFGSVLEHTEPASDVDLLLVYPDGQLSEAHAVAEAIRNRTDADYDVLALSDSEARETNFVESERALLIWPR